MVFPNLSVIFDFYDEGFDSFLRYLFLECSASSTCLLKFFRRSSGF